jgi:hypothetical protein
MSIFDGAGYIDSHIVYDLANALIKQAAKATDCFAEAA